MTRRDTAVRGASRVRRGRRPAVAYRTVGPQRAGTGSRVIPSAIRPKPVTFPGHPHITSCSVVVPTRGLTMRMPSFDAEASLSRISGHYGHTMSVGGSGLIVPAGLCGCHCNKITPGGYAYDCHCDRTCPM